MVLYQSGIFAGGVQYPVESIDRTQPWMEVDPLLLPTSSFWDELAKEPESGSDAVLDLSHDRINAAAESYVECDLAERLQQLKQYVSQTPGAFLVISRLEIQIDKEVMFDLLGVIIEELVQNDTEVPVVF